MSNDKPKYKNPNITISKVYTKNGDKGETDLIGGKRLSKDNSRICAYGEIDELNSIIGGCRQILIDLNNNKLNHIADILYRIQNELFNLGTMIATDFEKQPLDLPAISNSNIIQLEKEIDLANEHLSNLKSFVLPGGSEINVWLHLSRTVCRRAERTCVSLLNTNSIDIIVVKYINRLSDALFVWSRYVNHILGCQETLWNPNK